MNLKNIILSSALALLFIFNSSNAHILYIDDFHSFSSFASSKICFKSSVSW